jgi:hypothetical protein
LSEETMRTLFVLSLICASTSLLALLGVSAMDIVPGPRAGPFRSRMMLIVGAFLVAWVVLSVWLRSRLGAEPHSAPPQWLRRVLMFVSITYLLAVVVLLFG